MSAGTAFVVSKDGGSVADPSPLGSLSNTVAAIFWTDIVAVLVVVDVVVVVVVVVAVAVAVFRVAVVEPWGGKRPRRDVAVGSVLWWAALNERSMVGMGSSVGKEMTGGARIVRLVLAFVGDAGRGGVPFCPL